ncbi:12040_t:CDS:2, partial [Racocetra persica]
MDNPIIFDTHCHLADEKYQNLDLKEIIRGGEKAGVKFILNVGYDGASNQKVVEQLKRQLELAQKYDLPVLLHIREAFADAYEI